MTISQDHFLLSKSLWKSLRKRKRGRGEPNQIKTKQETVENPLTGSASMECILVFRLPTQAEHQKLGLSLSSILTGSGYCGATGAVLNSNTLCLCGMRKHSASAGCVNTNTSWSNRRGCRFYSAFSSLSHTLKHLILVQFSKPVIQSNVQFTFSFIFTTYHIISFPFEYTCWIIIEKVTHFNNFCYWHCHWNIDVNSKIWTYLQALQKF